MHHDLMDEMMGLLQSVAGFGKAQRIPVQPCFQSQWASKSAPSQYEDFAAGSQKIYSFHLIFA